jgi:5-methylcytosine-specific restriction endonuclease McrA
VLRGRRRVDPGPRIDYSLFQLGKKRHDTPSKDRARRKRKAQPAANADRDTVFQRQGWVCFAVGVSPVCTGDVCDPHELIPVSRGGPRVSWNRVGLCRTCHRQAQGRVGGIRLVFTWVGKDQGQQPNADQRGNVTCSWRERTAA